MASQVHAKEQVTQSDISGSARSTLVVNKLMIRLTDLQRHLERIKSEDIARNLFT